VPHSSAFCVSWDWTQVIKFGGLVVVTLIVFIHIVKLVKEAIAEIRKPHP